MSVLGAITKGLRGVFLAISGIVAIGVTLGLVWLVVDALPV